ncbi:MAG: M81 family metallopeptidase [Alphaproteobacteria bacterium]|jgi:microcystin degradation protein MlrC|nr:M81 family metallopeptidase [Alphaproteobacteria bacterium]
MARRVLVASIKHETNTFSRVPADVAAFEARYCYRGEAIPRQMRGTKVEMAAFFDAAERHGWHLTYPIATSATPSGKVTRAAYDTFAAEIFRALDDEAPFDAILLALHGAMVLEDEEDGEGLLLQQVRDKVGAALPIGVSLDLHANVTDRMAALADVMISYRTYPHIDQYEIAAQVAELIRRTMAREIRPRVVVARRAMLDGADHGRTTAPGPMTETLALADRLLAEQPGLLAASINGGFPWADIHDVGPTAVVVADGEAPAEAAAETLIDEIWRQRHLSTIETVEVATAIEVVREAAGDDGPVVIADFADNPGGGGYGDATGLLGGMIEAGLEDAAFATICDPEAAAACHAAGVGASLSLALGGKIEARYGAPIQLTGTVQGIADGSFQMEGPMAKGTAIDMGPTAVLRVGGIDIVVNSNRHQVLDRGYFRHVGIEPETKAVLAVKSAHHFRAAFAPMAARVVVVDEGGGLTSRNYKTLPYEKARRPVFPLDLD